MFAPIHSYMNVPYFDPASLPPPSLKVSFGGRTSWHTRDDLRLRSEAGRPATTPAPAPAPPPADYPVGTEVVLARGYADFSDAARGPLKPGERGVITTSDGSSKPYVVKKDGRTVRLPGCFLYRLVLQGEASSADVHIFLEKFDLKTGI